jgi:hypothetical protein
MKQKEIIGAFVRVPVDETYHTYARIVNKLIYAFYDFKTTSETPDLESVENADVLFKLIVNESAINSLGWKIIGVKELPENLKLPVSFFKQEIGNHNDCSIITDDHIKKVDPTECAGLERLAVWNHIHVEQRLKDYYNGVLNAYTHALRLDGIRSDSAVKLLANGKKQMKTMNIVRPTINWRKQLIDGNDFFTEKAVRDSDKLLDDYSAALQSAKTESAIWDAIKQVVQAFDTLNIEHDYFIETVEREELAEYIQRAAEAAGLIYDGDVTEEWREDW